MKDRIVKKIPLKMFVPIALIVLLFLLYRKTFLYLSECTSCAQRVTHRDQRSDLARLVDVDNVWGRICSKLKPKRLIKWRRDRLYYLFLYFFFTRRVIRKGRQKCWRSFVLPRSPRQSARDKTREGRKLNESELNWPPAVHQLTSWQNE